MAYRGYKVIYKQGGDDPAGGRSSGEEVIMLELWLAVELGKAVVSVVEDMAAGFYIIYQVLK
jgi:hypothetical protein